MAELSTDFPSNEGMTIHQKLDILLESQKLFLHLLLQQPRSIPNSLVHNSATRHVPEIVEQPAPRVLEQPSPRDFQQPSSIAVQQQDQQQTQQDEEDAFLHEAVKIKTGCSSVGNFATKLLQDFFSKEQLVNRNCTGTRGKQILDPVKLGAVKKYVFKLYPAGGQGQADAQWRKCIVAIDEFLRRKKNCWWRFDSSSLTHSSLYLCSRHKEFCVILCDVLE